ncbi:tigger transposable element-derived protein 4-like [Culex pipiens pallens]|uniref:tigger transposable element-derived protein 4-like n=1 Tax=Culex pipiens pallens TaxID=42434 RepID=UPI001953AC01|nr:tigger transposable element-derived protein 4-like [Culex pipiens pallens]
MSTKKRKMPETRRKLTVLTIEERLQIIQLHESGWKIGEIASDCKVPQSTVSTVVKNKQKWLEKKHQRHMRKTRVVGDVRLEKSMELFVQQARDNDMRLTCSMIREKALEFAEQFGNTSFKASSGWLDKFAKRHLITLRKAGGESGDRMDTDLYTVPELIRGYAPRDIVVASETGLLFGCLPDEADRFLEEACAGGEYSDERITLLCATNMDGSEKLPLLVIGNLKEPCFKDTKSLPVTYESNSKAWMTSAIFERWILSLDSKFEQEHRQVVMFVESSPVHSKSLPNKLKCINLQFFPTNATSDLRPLDLVIKTFKYHYRFSLVNRRLEEIEQEKEFTKVTLLDAISFISRAWVTDLKPTSIANCFRKAGFIFPAEDPLNTAETLEDVPATISDAVMAHLAGPGVTFLDYCNVDDGLATSGLMSDSDIMECAVEPVRAAVKVEPIEESQRSTSTNAWSSVVRSNLEAVSSILAATENVPAEIFGHFFALEKFLKERYK